MVIGYFLEIILFKNFKAKKSKLFFLKLLKLFFLVMSLTDMSARLFYLKSSFSKSNIKKPHIQNFSSKIFSIVEPKK